jgi:hypothetical protein
LDQSRRRKFLAACLGAIAAAGVCATLYPVYRYLAPRKGDEYLAKVSFPESEVPAGGALLDAPILYVLRRSYD